MGNNTPDFRKLSPEQIRDEISQLNKLIAFLHVRHKEKKRDFYTGWGIGGVGAVAMTAAFPPIAFLAFTMPVMMTLDASLQAQIVRDTLVRAESLRAQFKEVYRARPGRKQFNLAARRTREENRKPKGLKKFLPKFPKK